MATDAAFAPAEMLGSRLHPVEKVRKVVEAPHHQTPHCQLLSPQAEDSQLRNGDVGPNRKVCSSTAKVGGGPFLEGRFEHLWALLAEEDKQRRA